MLMGEKLLAKPKTILMGGLALSLLVVGAIFILGNSSQGESSLLPRRSFAYAATQTDKGQAIFEQKCQGCHTIGGGKTVGPDLKDITAQRDRDWLARFIASPDRLIAQQDPLATQLLKEYGLPMPNMGLSPEEAKEVLAYIEARSGKGGSPIVAPAQTGDATIGRDLFTGKIPLENGGPACLSCHNTGGIGALGGGAVAKDLTSTYSALGEQGLTAVLKSTPFPMMREVYAAKPLTDSEVANMVAYLKGVAGGEKQSPAPWWLFLALIGLAGALLVLGVFQLLWRGRISGVRRPLVKGG